LTEDLLLLRGGLSLLLIAILALVVWESHRIETNRVRAEAGMLEAKNRYRALAEASNEGYLLEIEGKIIYSSPTLRRMLDQREEELATRGVWDLLSPDTADNRKGITLLHELVEKHAQPVDFAAQIALGNDRILDVLVSPSRIFLSDKEGHILSFRPLKRSEVSIGSAFYGEAGQVVGQHFDTLRVRDVCRPLDGEVGVEDLPTISEDALALEALTQLEEGESDTLQVVSNVGGGMGLLSYRDLALLIAGLPASILTDIRKSSTTAQVIQALNRLSLLVREMTDEGAKPDALRRAIGMVHDAAVDRFATFAIDELGPPPAEYAFLSLGSSARHEMTLFSDQDNALVYADVSRYDEDRALRYFLNLANRVCTLLNEAGYPYCPGGLMAVNPKYCLPLARWKERFAEWMNTASPESILEINVFYDIRCVHGNAELATALIDHVQNDLRDHHPGFLQQFTRNCLLYKAPLDLFGKIRGEKHDGVLTVNVKDSLKPIEIFARIYAFQYDLTETGTAGRLRQLYEMEVLSKRFYRDILYVFDYLWRVRFHNQILSHVDLRQVNNELDLEALTDVERENLRNVMSRIPTFQEKLCSDFLGMPMYRSLESV
jgi:PAS domain S-box-containing protein